jgi:hypothetical protein
MEYGQLEKIVNQFVELILLMGLTLKFSFLKTALHLFPIVFTEGRVGEGWRWDGGGTRLKAAYRW